MKAKLLLPLLLVLHLLVACEPITSTNKEYVEYIVRNQNNNFSTSQTVNGTLTVNGNIVQNGESYEMQSCY